MTQNIFRSNVSQSALIFILFLSFLFIMDRSLQGISASSIAGNISAMGSAVSETGASSTGAEVSQAQNDGIAAQSALTAKATGAEALAAKQKLGSAPAFFVQNKGQKEGGSLFYSTGSGYDFYVGKTSVTYAFSSKNSMADAAAVGSSSFELNINFAGANADPVVTGANELNGKVNYLIGQDESKWQKNLSTYGGVTYQNLYSGIDLSYIGDATKIKYEFKVAPGANPSNIAMAYSGANGLKTDASGNLLIATPHGQLMDEKPTSYQMVNGNKVPVDTAFAVAGSTVGFKLGAYDKGLPLFVDPGIAYSTFLGGSGADEANDIYVDEDTGDMYVTGGTTSDDFPVTADASASMAGPLDKRYNSGGDVFVSKFNASGDLVYSTFIGGSANDEGRGIRVNDAFQIVVAGETSSYNYPCPPGAYDRFYNGGVDAFITILNPSGSSISKSTYFGTAGEESVFALEMGDTDKPILIGAVSGSSFIDAKPAASNLPTYLISTNTSSPTMIAEFSADISPASSGLEKLVYLQHFTLKDTAIDASERLYLTGFTSDSSFISTSSAFDQECGALGESDCEDGRSDAVAMRLGTTGATNDLQYSTYIGGFGKDFGQAIAVNDDGEAFISGATDSCDFPEPSVFDSNYFEICSNGLYDEFLVKLNEVGTSDVYIQRFGGQADDGASGATPSDQYIGLDSYDNPVIVGFTKSVDFPITAGAIDNVKSENNEVFIARIDVAQQILDSIFDCCSGLDSSNLSYSTFFGWGFTPQINQIVVDQNDVLHLTGSVSSSIYPTTVNAFDQSQNGGQDAFVTKIDLINDFTPQVNAIVNPDSPDGENGWYKKKVDTFGNLIPPAITLLSTGNGPSFYQWNSIEGNWTIYTGTFEPLTGDDNTLYFYGSDQSGATGDVFSLDIKWDPLDPGAPSLTSTSHSIGVPSNQQIISFDLGGNYLSVDPTSGIDYFNYKLGPECVPDVDQSFTLSTSSQFFDTGIAPLSETAHTLMIQAVDNAGNKGAVSCFGPYIVDITAPVSSLSKTPDPNDGHYDWYKSTPKISLSTESGAKTFYKWDASYDNTGYYYATEDAQTIGTGGATLDIRGDDVADSLDFASVNLPFDFNYFGATYDKVYLSSNGLLTFDGLNTKHLNSDSELQKINGIAPLWDDLRTDGHATDDIYVATSDSWISFRWQSRVYSIGDQEVNFEAVLYKDGTIRFNYGKQEGALSATIGISDGDCSVDGDCIILDGVADTNMQNSKIFIPSKWETYAAPFDGKSGVHTLYYYSVDIAGNEENPLGSQLFKVDPDRPVGVTDLSSATHTVDTPTSVATIEAHWTAAVDPISGVDGYSVEWSTIDPVAYFKRGENHPDSSMDVNKDETATSDIFTATANGSWYFYIRVKDNAGHWSPGDSVGPFVIDSGAGVPDTIKPDTFILSGPSGTIASSSATFTFTGTDNVTASGDLVYSAMLVGKDLTFDAFSTATSRSYTGLTNGPYIFKVRARDTASPANNVDDTPAEQAFTVLSTESSLTVIKAGTGSGTIRSTPDAGAIINCGVDCSETFPSSADVTLLASADPGSYFFGWTGAAVSCGSNPSCAISIPINSAQTATATFKTIPIGATYDETSSSVVYQSSCWSNYSDAGFVGGTAKISKKKGCLATLNFTGESVSFISAKSKQLGKAKIFIDGVLQTTVDLYSPSTLYQQAVYTSPTLTNGVHTMSIQVDGTKNASSTGLWVPIDAFTVFG